MSALGLLAQPLELGAECRGALFGIRVCGARLVTCMLQLRQPLPACRQQLLGLAQLLDEGLQLALPAGFIGDGLERCAHAGRHGPLVGARVRLLERCGVIDTSRIEHRQFGRALQIGL